MEIKDMVSSYRLSPKVEEKIVRISAQRIEELGLHSFEERYRYVARLIEIFQQRYADRFDLRLDAPIDTDDSKVLLHDCFGIPTLPTISDSNTPNLPLDLAIAVADPYLSEHHKNILQRLLGGVESRDILLPNQEQVNLNAATLRLESLVKYLEQDGNIIYPERPIVSVNFDSENLQVQWGKRNYDGNPLAYFRKHLDVYAGMSRHKLRNVDSGLSDALYRYGQIDEAIAKRGTICREPRTGEEVARIVHAYTLYNGNCRLSAKELGIDFHEVRKVWRKQKLIAQGGVQRRLPPDDVSRIVKAYDIYGGNATLSEEKLGIKRSNIRNVWKRHKLSPKGKSSNNFTPQEKSQIIEAHQFYNGNCTEAAARLGYSLGGVWKIWNQSGLRAVGSRFGNSKK
ncbi:MAG: hypothetical protein Q7K45_03970 [Nanoarchaeota archaeon]|nr:hypothetical protein [Nanoarchaeota archaeon]